MAPIPARRIETGIIVSLAIQPTPWTRPLHRRHERAAWRRRL